MPKRLTGSAGTGKKILQNQSLFNYTYIDFEPLGDNILYKFTWTFGVQSGNIGILLKPDKQIDYSSIISCQQNSREFSRLLGLYNDPSLYDVFKMMLLSQNVSCQ